MEAFKGLLVERPGSTRVVLHVPAPTGATSLPMELRRGVAYDAELLAEVRRRLGRGIVELSLAEETARAMIAGHFAALGVDDDRAAEIYADDAVLEFPQSRERIRGKANIVASRKTWPGPPCQVRAPPILRGRRYLDQRVHPPFRRARSRTLRSSIHEFRRWPGL